MCGLECEVWGDPLATRALLSWGMVLCGQVPPRETFAGVSVSCIWKQPSPWWDSWGGGRWVGLEGRGLTELTLRCWGGPPPAPAPVTHAAWVRL